MILGMAGKQWLSSPGNGVADFRPQIFFGCMVFCHFLRGDSVSDRESASMRLISD